MLEQIKGFQNLPWKINQKQRFESLFFRISIGSYFLVNLNFPWRTPLLRRRFFFGFTLSELHPKTTAVGPVEEGEQSPAPTQEIAVKVPLPGDSKWPFYSPSWKSRNLSKRSLHHPKKVTQNCQVLIFEKKAKMWSLNPPQLMFHRRVMPIHLHQQKHPWKFFSPKSLKSKNVKTHHQKQVSVLCCFMSQSHIYYRSRTIRTWHRFLDRHGILQHSYGGLEGESFAGMGRHPDIKLALDSNLQVVGWLKLCMH